MPAVVLFDGVCNLCNGFVRFVIARDLAGRFQFAALQSGAARRLLAGSHTRSAPPDSPLPDSALADSIVLVEGGRVFVRSAAALRIARSLRFPWPMMYGLMVVPRVFRDWAYDVVARKRYRWFGRRDACMVPTPELSARFLDE